MYNIYAYALVYGVYSSKHIYINCKFKWNNLVSAKGWEMEALEIVDPDTDEHDLPAMTQKWKDIGATALKHFKGKWA